MSATGEMLFTFIACQDLKRIWESIAIPTDVWRHTNSDNLAAAQGFATDFSRHCALLAKNPDLGLPREELLHELRSSTFEKYVIFYRLRGKSVEVVRVLRKTRDIEPSA